jgi:RsiW-degrading membrane proteinase PrsW (M82 family)
MAKRRDPLAEAAGDDRDLYGIATWEPRSPLDRLAVLVYRALVAGARGAVVFAGLVLFVGIGGFSAVTDPQVGLLTVLSAVPALGLAGYVYLSDVTASEPLDLLVPTFLLAVLTASFAAILNTVADQAFGLRSMGVVGSVLFFFLVVGPVEETVKLLAVRLYAYGDERFDTVVDGAVYGAVAGLGFAFIENALYITRQAGDDLAAVGFGLELVGAGGGITAVRALAGPGHVIYSAVAGYYLGLAKFNPEYRGPLVIKGLVLAAVVHALYNSSVGVGAAAIRALTGLSPLAAFFAFVVAFDGAFALLLLNKVRTYNDAVRAADAESAVDGEAGDEDGAGDEGEADDEGGTADAPTPDPAADDGRPGDP